MSKPNKPAPEAALFPFVLANDEQINKACARFALIILERASGKISAVKLVEREALKEWLATNMPSYPAFLYKVCACVLSPIGEVIHLEDAEDDDLQGLIQRSGSAEAGKA